MKRILLSLAALGALALPAAPALACPPPVPVRHVVGRTEVVRNVGRRTVVQSHRTVVSRTRGHGHRTGHRTIHTRRAVHTEVRGRR
jgi:hypothetical protein